MLRIAVRVTKYVEWISILEVQIDFFYEKTIDDFVNLNVFSKNIINMIEKISNECRGEFLNVSPRGKINKDAKEAIFMTISFKNFEDIQKFNSCLAKMFNGPPN